MEAGITTGIEEVAVAEDERRGNWRYGGMYSLSLPVS
jgi:hypothetical protein